MSRRGRVVAWSAAVAVLVAGGAVGGVLALRGPSDDEAAAAAGGPPAATAEVERGTLSGTSTQVGTLTRPDGPVIGGPIAGTLTEVPAVGTVLHPRDVLYRVDDEPVVLFDGTVPAWRSFEAGMEKGPDVRQLEANLEAWGYLGVAADDVFDWRTTRAVRAWQKDAGLERTGTVELGRVLFRSGELVVSDVQVDLGAQAVGGTIYATKRSERVATVDLPVGSQFARTGTTAQVELPDGTAVPGSVREVGPAHATDDGSTTVTVTLGLDDQAAVGDLTDASVSVDFVTEVHEDVLSVPLLALGAAADGGFVVDVVQPDGSTRPVPVETGLFAGDRVEITGDVEAGDRVVVPEDS